jgi:hypothetical protein
MACSLVENIESWQRGLLVFSVYHTPNDVASIAPLSISTPESEFLFEWTNLEHFEHFLQHAERLGITVLLAGVRPDLLEAFRVFSGAAQLKLKNPANLKFEDLQIEPAVGLRPAFATTNQSEIV